MFHMAFTSTIQQSIVVWTKNKRPLSLTLVVTNAKNMLTAKNQASLPQEPAIETRNFRLFTNKVL